MRLFVRCDREGNITSAMKVQAMDDALTHPYGYVEEGEVVMELKMPKGVEDIESHEIRELYKVDVKGNKLTKLRQKSVKKAPKKAAKKGAKQKSRKGRT